MTLPRPQVPRVEPIETISDVRTGGLKLPPSGYWGYIFSVVVAVIASFVVLFMYGVPKQDVVKFQVDTKASVDALSSDLRASTSSIKVATDGVSSVVNTKVEASLGSVNARLNMMEADIKTIKDDLNRGALRSEAAINNANSLIAQVDFVKSSIRDIQKSVEGINFAAVESKVNLAESQITAIRNELTTLQNQYSLMAVVINTLPANFLITNSSAIGIPLSITNSGAAALNVLIKLTLTTSGAVVVTSASSPNAATTINGATVTFTYNVGVGAGYTVAFNVPVTLNYTGVSPNTWTATWSK